MDNITENITIPKRYRKDFTPEEKVKYNEYIKQRMRVYHDSEKGRKARAAYYQLKKARKQEQQGVIMSAA